MTFFETIKDYILETSSKKLPEKETDGIERDLGEFLINKIPNWDLEYRLVVYAEEGYDVDRYQFIYRNAMERIED